MVRVLRAKYPAPDLTELSAPRALAEWIKNYFSVNPTRGSSAFDMLQSSPVVTSDKLPVILQVCSLVLSGTCPLSLLPQHSGHSRTVIGYEVDRKHNVNLLVLDPARYALSMGCLILVSRAPGPSPRTFVVRPSKRFLGRYPRLLRRVPSASLRISF